MAQTHVHVCPLGKTLQQGARKKESIFYERAYGKKGQRSRTYCDPVDAKWLAPLNLPGWREHTSAQPVQADSCTAGKYEDVLTTVRHRMAFLRERGMPRNVINARAGVMPRKPHAKQTKAALCALLSKVDALVLDEERAVKRPKEQAAEPYEKRVTVAPSVEALRAVKRPKAQATGKTMSLHEALGASRLRAALLLKGKQQ